MKEIFSVIIGGAIEVAALAVCVALRIPRRLPRADAAGMDAGRERERSSGGAGGEAARGDSAMMRAVLHFLIFASITRSIAVLILALCAALAGCGGNGDDADDGEATTLPPQCAEKPVKCQ